MAASSISTGSCRKTVTSNHTASGIANVRSGQARARVGVRINPIARSSSEQRAARSRSAGTSTWPGSARALRPGRGTASAPAHRHRPRRGPRRRPSSRWRRSTSCGSGSRMHARRRARGSGQVERTAPRLRASNRRASGVEHAISSTPAAAPSAARRPPARVGQRLMVAPVPAAAARQADVTRPATNGVMNTIIETPDP